MSLREIMIDPASPESYALFLRIKTLPRYKVQGRTCLVPEEYMAALGLEAVEQAAFKYKPVKGLFDYQRDIARLAIEKRKFAVFAAPGLGKTFIMTEFARHASTQLPAGKKVLIVSPLMVVRQTLAEAKKLYGDSLPIAHVPSSGVAEFLARSPFRIGITNYEAFNKPIPTANLGALIPDESSMMKSAYGAWAAAIIEAGRGLAWKLCLTGTPAPNDRIEYANHAVFLDRFPTVNAFLARYFVNRGQTANRWELKPHALAPFYRELSDWAIFLERPETYGWKDNVGAIPPIHVHIHDVPLTDEQVSLSQKVTGRLCGGPGGITGRGKLSQLAKGRYNGKNIKTAKYDFIRELVESWPDESTIVWCRFNAEQDAVEAAIPHAEGIRGETSQSEREAIIERFKAGETRILISKPKVLGFGLNLQIATRQVFSGLDDSYEEYYQAVKRSNRIGSTKPLNVHLPVSELERPFVDSVLGKAARVQRDAIEQEEIFKAQALFNPRKKR